LDEIISSAVMQAEEGSEPQIEVEFTHPETLQQPIKKENKIPGEAVGKLMQFKKIHKNVRMNSIA
jgi:hypothetical protein